MDELGAPQPRELTAAEAASFLQDELTAAGQDLSLARLESGLDRYCRALGLALQLGPAPTERVLAAVLASARELALSGNGEALSALGPAVVDLVDKVCAADALPATSVMEAWATISAGVGALLGQVGLALLLPTGRGGSMMGLARGRARLLDDATVERFGLVTWLDGIAPGA
jgi:hypothetical protein